MEFVDDGTEVGDRANRRKIGRTASGSKPEGSENEREREAALVEGSEQSVIGARWVTASARQSAPSREDLALKVLKRVWCDHE